MSSRTKLIAGVAAVAVVAGGGAAMAAMALTSSRADSVSTVTAPLSEGVDGYGLDGGMLGGRGLGGGLGQGGRSFAGGFARHGLFGSGVGAAAAYLGMPVSTLRVELASGKTLASVAVAQNKTAAGLEAVMLAAREKALAALVASGRLTKAQEEQIEARLEERVKEWVENVRPVRSLGPVGGPPPTAS